MTGSLQKRYNRYYVVLNLKDEYGRRKQKVINTELEFKLGNKRKAEKMLRDLLKKYEDTQITICNNILFGDYMIEWLKSREGEIETSTYQGYWHIINHHIAPYFNQRKITLQEITASDIQKYYRKLSGDGLSANTIRRHHANIRKAINDAMKNNIVACNIADRVTLPKANYKRINYYSEEMIEKLLELVKGTEIEVCVYLGVFCGLRRSEVCGLRWKDVDFDNSTITICNTITRGNTLIEKERTKTLSSYRTMPLENELREFMLNLKEIQKQDKELFGSEYADNGYVCVWQDGRSLLPEYVSHKFKEIIQKNNMPNITFHGLRHTCATLLLSKRYDIKLIQEYLGHSSVVTTGNIYAHVQFSSKVAMGASLASIISKV